MPRFDRKACDPGIVTFEQVGPVRRRDHFERTGPRRVGTRRLRIHLHPSAPQPETGLERRVEPGRIERSCGICPEQPLQRRAKADGWKPVLGPHVPARGSGERAKPSPSEQEAVVVLRGLGHEGIPVSACQEDSAVGRHPAVEFSRHRRQRRNVGGLRPQVLPHRLVLEEREIVGNQVVDGNGEGLGGKIGVVSLPIGDQPGVADRVGSQGPSGRQTSRGCRDGGRVQPPAHGDGDPVGAEPVLHRL